MIQPATHNARNSLMASFCLFAALAVVMTLRHWTAHQNPVDSLGRGLFLIICLATLHLAGFSLYCNQIGWPRVQPLLRSALIQNCVVLFLLEMIPASGLERVAILSAAGYWATVGMIIARRPRLNGRCDTFAIRCGYIAMLIAVFFTLSRIR